MASESEDAQVPVLPPGTGISYLAEGAANIVYRISVRYPTPPPSVIEEYGDGTPPPTEIDDMDGVEERNADLLIYDNKLLRLRKNLPTTLPCAVSQKNWLRLVVPLFSPDQLVQQCLVQLGPSHAIAKLNNELRGWELYEYPIKGSLRSVDPRPTKRHGIYLAEDEHGLLVTDMTPGYIGEEVLEFKPKWLAQSPSAPPGSKRCRQCARQARADAESPLDSSGRLAQYFCPLDLVQGGDMALAASQMETNVTKTKRLQRWLETNKLLPRLRDAQLQLDPKGVFDTDLSEENFRLAMTLRDCTIFLRLPPDEKDDHTIEARLGDLDLKSEDKADYWKSTERQFIDEGWYTGNENQEYRQPINCSLSRSR